MTFSRNKIYQNYGEGLNLFFCRTCSATDNEVFDNCAYLMSRAGRLICLLQTRSTCTWTTPTPSS